MQQKGRPRIERPLPRAGHLVLAALLFGLAVHWRLYPIVFALPLLRHFVLQRQRRLPSKAPLPPRSLLASLLSWEGLAFGLLSGGTFLALLAGLYRLYGWQFLQETYLYHASRTDPRHNFSPYFLPAYLASSGTPGSERWDVGW